jgi:hypothetical protein
MVCLWQVGLQLGGWIGLLGGWIGLRRAVSTGLSHQHALLDWQVVPLFKLTIWLGDCPVHTCKVLAKTICRASQCFLC